jgi:glucose/arabinose dehydrogenase
VICVLLTLLLIMSQALAQPKLAIEPAFPKLPAFDRPIFLTFIPDGSDRIVVVEQVGRVFWFENKQDVMKAHLACDLSPRIRVGGEEGLLGFAFHPKFKENHQVIMHFTARDGQRRNIVARFTMDEHSKIVPDSQEIILEVAQPESNHNGGMIAFGKDGFLYIALGDGGGGGDQHGPIGNGQNKNTLLGKILRIDVDKKDGGKNYAIPQDNPFVNQPNARGEIFAYGLRNPWRFSIDRKTGELWAGDVGQNAWEEVDIVEKGKNYGWNLMEGTHNFRARHADEPATELIAPVAEHKHGEGNCVTGGYVYRGREIADLQGWYVYGDYATSLLWTMRMEGGKPGRPHYIARSPASPSSFGEDEAGEIYVVGYSGAMYRVVAGK